MVRQVGYYYRPCCGFVVDQIDVILFQKIRLFRSVDTEQNDGQQNAKSRHAVVYDVRTNWNFERWKSNGIRRGGHWCTVLNPTLIDGTIYTRLGINSSTRRCKRLFIFPIRVKTSCRLPSPCPSTEFSERDGTAAVADVIEPIDYPNNYWITIARCDYNRNIAYLHWIKPKRYRLLKICLLLF